MRLCETEYVAQFNTHRYVQHSVHPNVLPFTRILNAGGQESWHIGRTLQNQATPQGPPVTGLGLSMQPIQNQNHLEGTLYDVGKISS